MTKEELQEALRNHPDTIEIEFAGKERPYFIGNRTFALLRERGFDPNKVFPFDLTEEEIEEEGITGQSDRAAQLVWAGLLPFDEDLELEDVEALMSAREMTALYREIIQRTFGAALDLADEAEGN